MPRRHALISGAGIAGPALAHQLTRRGWRATVLERFPQQRDEGQNVDIRGSAREVVRRMGVEDAVRAANTGEVGTRFVTATGSPVASFPVAAHGRADGPTAELEILRGELSRILIERTGDTEYRFGTQITDIVEDGDRVIAGLDDGTTMDTDLVVIAEGLHSRSRRFVAPVTVNDLGMYFAYATVPRSDDDDRWWNWQHATESRSVHLRPDNLGTTRAILTFLSDVRGFEDLDRAGQVTILRRTFSDVGGAAPRILGALDDGAPMYFSVAGQVKAPMWTRGRIALLGDAAFCNATFGGAGTSLALIGAYILAGELGPGADTDSDVPSALRRYEKTMRPFATAAPTVHAGALRLANPRTRTGLRLVHTVARVAAGPVGRAVTALAGRGLVGIGEETVVLPDYDAPR